MLRPRHVRWFIDRFEPKVRFSTTTNLVYRISDQHMYCFSKMIDAETGHPLICTSWDPEFRFRNSESDVWESNVRSLIENGIEVQCIICVSRPLLKMEPRQVYEKMMNLGIKRINFERLTLNGAVLGSSLRPSNKEQDEWLFRAYMAYLENDAYTPLFSSVEASMVHKLQGCRARRCTSNVRTINPDLTVSGCPNTAHRSAGTVRSIVRLDLEAKKEHTFQSSCLVCPYFAFCNGDCYQLSHDETGCPGMKSIYSYLMDKHCSSLKSCS